MTPLLRDESGYGTILAPTIGHGMKVCRIGVAFEKPVLATPLSPIFLLHLEKVGKLLLQMVSEGPTLVVEI